MPPKTPGSVLGPRLVAHQGGRGAELTAELGGSDLGSRGVLFPKHRFCPLGVLGAVARAKETL